MLNRKDDIFENTIHKICEKYFVTEYKVGVYSLVAIVISKLCEACNFLRIPILQMDTAYCVGNPKTAMYPDDFVKYTGVHGYNYMRMFGLFKQ